MSHSKFTYYDMIGKPIRQDVWEYIQYKGNQLEVPVKNLFVLHNMAVMLEFDGREKKQSATLMGPPIWRISVYALRDEGSRVYMKELKAEGVIVSDVNDLGEAIGRTLLGTQDVSLFPIDGARSQRESLEATIAFFHEQTTERQSPNWVSRVHEGMFVKEEPKPHVSEPESEQPSFYEDFGDWS